MLYVEITRKIWVLSREILFSVAWNIDKFTSIFSIKYIQAQY